MTAARTSLDFFLVGAAKAGTTAFYEFLSAHPQLFLPGLKEPHFYSLLTSGTTYLRPDGRPAMIMKTAVRDRADYYALFDGHDGRVKGEASSSYLYVPGTAEALRREHPEAKIIAILRNPIDRAFSSYLHLRREMLEPLTLERALLAEPDRIAGNVGLLWRYVDVGLYARQLEAFLAAFPRSQVHIILYDDFRSDPAATLRTVYAFLGVDAGFQPDTSVRVNVGGEPRNPSWQRLLKLPKLLPAHVKTLPGARHVRTWLVGMRGANLARPSMPTAARALLVEAFAQDVATLEAILERPLSQWGYAPASPLDPAPA